MGLFSAILTGSSGSARCSTLLVWQSPGANKIFSIRSCNFLLFYTTAEKAPDAAGFCLPLSFLVVQTQPLSERWGKVKLNDYEIKKNFKQRERTSVTEQILHTPDQTLKIIESRCETINKIQLLLFLLCVTVATTLLMSGGAECAVASLCISGNFANYCPLQLPSCSELFSQCHSQSDKSEFSCCVSGYQVGAWKFPISLWFSFKDLNWALACGEFISERRWVVSVGAELFCFWWLFF